MASECHDRVLMAFFDFDINGSGTIDPLELKRVFQKLDPEHFNDALMDRLFEAADANKDGKVDLREFIKWIFSSDDTKAALETLDRERMQKVSSALASVDLPWMKRPVDTTAFNNAILTFIKQSEIIPSMQEETDDGDGSEPFVSAGDLFDLGAGTDTLPIAHALLSVSPHALPSQVWLQPSERQVSGEIVEVPLTDDLGAPLLYASVTAGCESVAVQGAEFGEKMAAALEHALPGSRTRVLSLSSGYIRDEQAVVRIVNAIREDSLLERIDLSNNVVGLFGLFALQAALLRCPTLRHVYLYNIGPWTDGDGLGCRRDPQDDDVVTLVALRNAIKRKKGTMQNEAFHEGDVEMSDDDSCRAPAAKKDKQGTVARAAFVKNNTLPGGRIMLRSRPAAGGRYASGYIGDGQSVLVLRESSDGQWANIYAPMTTPLKGWLKTQNLRSA